jgi:hypothetical protein
MTARRSVLRRLGPWVRRVRDRMPAPVARLISRAKDRLPRTIVDTAMGYEMPDTVSPPPAPPTTQVRLYVAPANFAGQAWALARAAERELPTTGAVTFCPSDTGFGFDTDYTVPQAIYLDDRGWQNLMVEYVTGSFTHVLIEAARPIFGRKFGRDIVSEVATLRAAGLVVATLAHGTDIRVPSLHAERHAFTPFTGDLIPEQPLLEERAVRNLARLRRIDAQHFVTTPDLLEFLPEATWCPVVVDVARWRQRRGVLESATPVVVHAPSKSAVKGSDIVDPLLTDAPHLDYRRISGVPAAEMPAHYRAADIVLDQFRLGSYGVAACEAMAAGRVVIGNVTPAIRALVRDTIGLDLPIVQSEGHDVVEVIDELVAHPDRAREIAASGPVFVQALHSGRHSVEVLRPFLGKKS